ncbi:S41 family peptidase [Spirosoma daeguense]
MIRLFQFVLCLGYVLQTTLTLSQSVQKLSADELRADLQQIQEVLQKWHPGYAEYNSVEKLTRHFDTLHQQLTQPMTVREFQRVARVAVAGVQCLHTSVSLPAVRGSGQSTPLFFPIPVAVTSDRKLIRQASSDTICLINGYPAPAIVDTLRLLFSSDGPNESFRNWVLNRHFGALYTARFGLADSIQIHVKTPEGEEIQNVTAKSKLEIPATYLSGQPHSVVQTSSAMTLYRLSDKPNVAILQLRSVGGLLDRFRLKKALRYVQKQAIQHVVLDLRNNTGGRIWNATSFLKYVLPNPTTLAFERYKEQSGKSPFKNSNAQIRLIYYTQLALKTKVSHTIDRIRYTYSIKPAQQIFTGKLTVLINGGTASAASLIAAYLQEQSRATLLGQETGGSRFVSAGLMVPTVRLVHSQLRLKVPMFQVIHASTATNDGSGVKPDFMIEEWASQNDVVMSRALDAANL